MTFDAYLTLALLLATFLCLIFTRIPPPATFLGALTAAMTLGLAPVGQCLKGFSNQGMLTVGALYMVAAGMYSTGAISIIVDKLIGKPKTTFQAQIKMLPAMAVGSGFLNNTPLVAMMMPVIRDLAKPGGLSAARLYMPLSFASILGGACTLIGTSTNLVIAGLIADQLSTGSIPGLSSISMFDPAWVGVPAAIAGLALIIIGSKWLFPKDTMRKTPPQSTRVYQALFEVLPDSPFEGKTVAQAGFVGRQGFCLESLSDGVNACVIPAPDYRFGAGDLLRFSTDEASLVELWRTVGLRPHVKLNPMETERHTHQLVKAVIARRSRAVGRRLSEMPRPGSPYQLKVVALSREGDASPGDLEDIRIEAGDKVILEVNDSFFFINANDREFALTRPLEGYNLQHTKRAMAAGLITGIMIAIVALGQMSMLQAALLASGAMLLTGCLKFANAGRAIDWGTLIVIACAIGLESAVTQSGLAKYLGHGVNVLGAGNPQLALAAIFIGCTIMTNIITNNAAAAFMFPIALATAQEMGVSFMPFAITLMLAASCAFITPTGYQTNLMVWEPGGYKFTDFAKAGLPLTILVAAFTILLTPLVYGF